MIKYFTYDTIQYWTRHVDTILYDQYDTVLHDTIIHYIIIQYFVLYDYE